MAPVNSDKGIETLSDSTGLQEHGGNKHGNAKPSETATNMIVRPELPQRDVLSLEFYLSLPL